MRRAPSFIVASLLILSLLGASFGSARSAGAKAWTGWTSLGGVLSDSLSAANFGGRVYVFAKGSDKALYVKSSADGTNFTEWSSLGGVLTAAPAAASSGGKLYVFARGYDNALYVKSSSDGSTFTDWSSLGGVLTAAPAATSVSGVLYVFAKGADNSLYEKHSSDGAAFTGWRNLGGVLTAAPAASGFQGRLVVFAKGSDNALYAKDSVDGGAWSPWRNLGGVLTAAPAAASYTPTGSTEVLYSFAKGADNALYERHTSDGANWTEWLSLCGDLVSPPTAASAGGSLLAFARWSDNALWARHTTTGPPGSCNQSPAPNAQGTVLVRNSTSYVRSTDRYIVGEVVNTSSTPARYVKVDAKYYDANDRLVAVAYSYTYLEQTDPGTTNPFNIGLANAPSSIVRYELSISWNMANYHSYRGATVLSQSARYNNAVEVFGEVRNDNARKIQGIRVAVTFYDEFGNVIQADYNYPLWTRLAPGASSDYRISTWRTFAYASYRVQAQGYLWP